VRKEIAYFTSFYSYSFTRGLPDVLRARAWPRITRFEDRWGWIVTSVVPRFRMFDGDPPLDRRQLATHRRRCADLRVDAVYVAARWGNRLTSARPSALMRRHTSALRSSYA
jgi:hypothetical protein